ncbi:30013_t:CDS:1, partial [Racocetra persica]
LAFESVCHVYVTDCNGQVIRNAGWKDCGDSTWDWDDAPDVYCIHIYPRTNSNDNKYCQGYRDACFQVHGDLLDGFEMRQYDDCAS